MIVFPSSPGFKAINIRMNDPTISHRAQSGKRITRKMGGHLWSFTLTYPPLTKAAFSPVLGAIAKARGSYQTFTVIPPNLAMPLGTQLNDTTVSVTKAAGNTSVTVSGATVGATFKAGDVIKFSNHNKVYMITDDATANGSGVATINIVPPLLTSITATTDTAKHRNVPFTVAFSNDLQEIKTDVAGFNSYEIDVEEVP